MKTKVKSKRICYFLSALWVVTTAVAYGQEVSWDEAGASLTGDGCEKNVNAYVISFGTDVSLIFSNLGVQLSGQTGPTAASRGCNFRIPATVPLGYFVGDLSQTLIYGVTKSADADVTLKNIAKFFNLPVTTPEVSLGRGQAVNDPFLSQSRRDRFSVGRSSGWVKAWCKRDRSLVSNFQGRISIRGQRKNKEETLIAFVDGLDLKYEIDAQVTACP